MPEPRRWTIRVCECGTIGRTIGEEAALQRCGQDGRTNMRSGCPIEVVEVVEAFHGEPSRGGKHE